MEKWEKHYNEQKGIYEIYPTKACNPRVCAVMNQTEEESIANLIAAAPDLLVVSKIAQALWDNNLKVLKKLTPEGMSPGDFIDEAIAKADK